MRALLLDALGTLVELEPPAPLLVRALRERCGLEVSEEQAARALRAEIAYYREHHDEARDAASLAGLRARSAAALRDALPPEAARLPLGPLTEALLAALRFRPFPEVPATLRLARERGIRLIVVSNWDVSLHDALDATGLAPLVDGALTSAEVGCAKPGGAIFARGLELAGVGAEAALHVGDSVEHDVVGARAAGIDVRLVVRDGEPAPTPGSGIATVRSLRELPGVGGP